MVMTDIRHAPGPWPAAADPPEIVLTCPNCGASVRVRRGDPAKTKKPYICTCGTELEPDPADGAGNRPTWLRIA
jgi:hypothetical protein